MKQEPGEKKNKTIYNKLIYVLETQVDRLHYLCTEPSLNAELRKLSFTCRITENTLNWSGIDHLIGLSSESK